MPSISPKKKDLYLGKCLGDLHKLGEIRPLNTGANVIVRSLSKVFEDAEKFDTQGDEEKAFVMYMKYFNILKTVKTKADYKKQKEYFDSLIGSKNQVKAIERAEKLADSLKERYDLKEAEAVARKLASLDTDTSATKPSEKKVNENKAEDTKGEKAPPAPAPIPAAPSPPSGGIKCQTLCELLRDSNTRLVLMDARPGADFSKSHISHTECISVPEEIIVPGSTVNHIQAKLPSESQTAWHQRKHADHIILIDWKSTVENVVVGTPLRTLKDALFKFDVNTIIKSEPLVLEGGYEQWLMFYPMMTTNPHVAKPSDSSQAQPPSPTMMLDFDYPDLDDNLQTVSAPEVSSPSENQPLGDSNLKSEVTFPMYFAPRFDRSLKPSRPAETASSSSGTVLNNGRSQVINNSVNGSQVRSDKVDGPSPSNSSLYPMLSVSKDPPKSIKNTNVLNDPTTKGPKSINLSIKNDLASDLTESVTRRQEKEAELQDFQRSRDNILKEDRQRLEETEKKLRDLEQMKKKEEKDVADLMRMKRKLKGELEEEKRRQEEERLRFSEEEERRLLALERAREEEEQKRQRMEEVEKMRADRKMEEQQRELAKKQQEDAERERREAEESARRLKLEEEERVAEREREIARAKKEEDERQRENEEKEMKQKEDERIAQEKRREDEKAKQEAVRMQEELEQQRTEAEVQRQKEREEAARKEEERKEQLEKKRREELERKELERKRNEDMERQEVERKRELERKKMEEAAREKAERERKAARQIKAIEQPHSKAVPSNMLPAGWEKRLDRATNRYFYIDHNRGTTQWIPPPSVAITRPADTYATKLKDEPSVTSSRGLTRSHSSPNIKKQLEEEEERSRKVMPSVDRGSKPIKNVVSVIPKQTAYSVRKRDLNPVFGNVGPALTGLRNLGNTCYMNSTVQCLNNTSPLVSYFLNDSYLHDINRESSQGMHGEVVDEFAVVIKALWSQQFRSITPRDLKSTVAKYNPMFAGYQQQDSQEFLTFLLDGLHEGLNEVRKAPDIPEQNNDNLADSDAAQIAWKHHKLLHKSVIVELFQGQLKSTLMCRTCGKTSVTFQAFMFLSLPIPASSKCSLKDCIQEFLKPEMMTGSSKWKCPRCKVERDSEKKIDIWKLPHILLVGLNRFYSEGMWMQKKTTYVDFPVNDLDFSPYIIGPPPRNSYNLYGISNHYGTMEGGHYTAFCRNPVNKKWYKFDDQDVHEMSQSEVKTSAAFVLYYTSIDMPAPQYTPRL